MSQVKKIGLKEALKLWEEKTGENKRKQICSPFSTSTTLKYFNNFQEKATQLDLMGWNPPIEKMDNSVSQIPYCQRLSLSTNMIERIGNLNPLKCLRILSIGRNYLKSLSGVEACADTLEEIWASYNQIEKPSKGVTHCKKLRVLYLANNSVREWPEMGRLAECPALLEIVFVGNPIEERYASTGNGGEWVREVAKRIPQLAKLDGLTIVHGTTTEENGEVAPIESG